jgi:hypothetical protein
MDGWRSSSELQALSEWHPRIFRRVGPDFETIWLVLRGPATQRRALDAAGLAGAARRELDESTARPSIASGPGEHTSSKATTGSGRLATSLLRAWSARTTSQPHTGRRDGPRLPLPDGGQRAPVVGARRCDTRRSTRRRPRTGRSVPTCAASPPVIRPPVRGEPTCRLSAADQVADIGSRSPSGKVRSQARSCDPSARSSSNASTLRHSFTSAISTTRQALLADADTQWTVDLMEHDAEAREILVECSRWTLGRPPRKCNPTSGSMTISRWTPSTRSSSSLRSSTEGARFEPEELEDLS